MALAENIGKKNALLWYPMTLIWIAAILIFTVTSAIILWQYFGESFNFSSFGDYGVIEYITESDVHANQFLSILAPWLGALAAIGFLIANFDIFGSFAALFFGSTPATLYSLHLMGRRYS